MREQLVERDGINCRHCGRPTVPPETGRRGGQSLDIMTIDHFPIPKRELPDEEWLDPSRAVIACLECNRRLDHETQVRGTSHAS